MLKNKGFTLIECIVTLAVYAMVLSLALGLYLYSLKVSNRIEQQADIEENLRVSVDRISHNIRQTNMPVAKIRIADNRLYIDQWQYYTGNGILYERKGSGVNQLALNITGFNPVLQDGTLTIEIEGSSNPKEAPQKAKLVIYLGG